MRRSTAVLFSLFMTGSSAMAATLEIEFPDAETVDTTVVTYDCDGEEVAATYYNVDTTSIAVVTIDGASVVMSNVLAASGAKYAGDVYVWWTQGDNADLYDLMKGEDAEPVSCSSKD